MNPKTHTLSVVIITLNEERNIARCLESLRFSKDVFARQEIMVVDAESEDKTAAIARKLGAKVIVRAWKGYSDQKNWAIARCKGEYILSLDADEELTPELAREIEEKVLETPRGVDGYFIKRKAYFLGKWIQHCGWWPDSQLRLIKRGSGLFTNKAVHEELQVKYRTLEFEHPMNHYTYDTIHQYLEKVNRYSDLAMKDIKPKKITFWMYYLTFAPFVTFLRLFFLRAGFMDGWHGFVVCSLSGFHDFCKYAKLWEKEVLKRV